MTAREIIAELARSREVEQIVRSTVKRDRLTPTDQDGCQLIYEYLLAFDEERIVDLYEKGQLGFFLVGVARRQFCSNNSKHYREHRRFTINSNGSSE